MNHFDQILAIIPRELEWQLDGVCNQTDPEIFYPEKGGSVLEPKGVCAGCPVRETCLEYALARDEPFGIWGGMSERERRREKRRRAAERTGLRLAA